MSYRKYLSDYSVEDYVDEKGRTKKRAVYTGGDYILTPAISSMDKRLVLAASIIPWPAVIGALAPRTRASQLYYVILPFVLSMIPLFLMTWAAVLLIYEIEPMTRERADLIANRLPYSSFFAALLAGIAFIGLIVAAVISGSSMLTGDILFGILSLVTTATTFFVFLKCRRIKAHRTDPE